jgi:hypothetical protein
MKEEYKKDKNLKEFPNEKSEYSTFHSFLLTESGSQELGK